jgi:hypothetical protein
MTTLATTAAETIQDELVYVHYNMCELRTTELLDPSNERIHALVNAILKITNNRVPDIFTIAELQYDQKGVPTPVFQTNGVNLGLLMKRITAQAKSNETYDTTNAFIPGNCGMDERAKKMPDGEYCNDRFPSVDMQLKYGDLNYDLALLPGQYSIAMAVKSSYQILQTIKISKLAWKKFNPQVDLTQFKDPLGNPLPDNIRLFEKGGVLCKIATIVGEVWVSTFHTEPAYGFGFKDSPNIARNGDQLRCIQWLITGKTDVLPPDGLKDDEGNPLKPLEGEKIVLSGDLNVDSSKTSKPGAVVINEMMEDKSFHTYPYKEPTETGSHQGIPIELQLDYIFSKGLTIVPGSEKIGERDPEKLSDHSPIATVFTN